MALKTPKSQVGLDSLLWALEPVNILATIIQESVPRSADVHPFLWVQWFKARRQASGQGLFVTYSIHFWRHGEFFGAGSHGAATCRWTREATKTIYGEHLSQWLVDAWGYRSRQISPSDFPFLWISWAIITNPEPQTWTTKPEPPTLNHQFQALCCNEPCSFFFGYGSIEQRQHDSAVHLHSLSQPVAPPQAPRQFKLFFLVDSFISKWFV